MAHQAEQAAEDRKAIMSLAQATLHAAQATSEDRKKVLETLAAQAVSEDRQKVLETLKDQSAALQVLIATLTNPDNPRGPWGGSPWGGSSGTTAE